MGNLWSRGHARSAIMGYEKTSNPTPAAVRLLGKKAVRSAVKKLKRGGRKRAHKGNPLPAVVGTLAGFIPGGSLVTTGLKALGIKTGSPRYEGGPLISTVQGFLDHIKAGDLNALQTLHSLATSPAEKHRIQWAKVWNQELPAMGGALPAKVRAAIVQLDPTSQLPSAGAVTMSPGAQLLGALGQPGTIRAIASAARPRASRRQRYPTYVTRGGRQRYSTQPPGGEMRLPAGAVPSPGTPYSFFQGAVGRGGAGATAGQLAVAGAAGVGAYLVTRKLLQYLGGGAQRKEEAGVNAARALHDSFEEYKANTGKYPPPAERAQMKAAYRAKLVELGYNPDTFTRERSGVESFLEDYNPLGG